ncbi:MAG: hypothetical protein MJ171_07845, partial [Clostridia bacterium]|nr:hypothetical protein [Clostridia bacterium]
YSMDIRLLPDGKVMVTEKTEKAWYSIPRVTEYYIDPSVMSEIEKVANRYHMAAWHNKKFSNMHVADGPSTGYSFDAESGDIWFSSQIYPTRYRNKLNELMDAIQPYCEKGEHIPGLVMPEFSDEEEIEKTQPNDGKVYMEPYYYYSNYFYYRFHNGSEEKIDVPMCAKITELETGKVVFEKDSSSVSTVYEKRAEEFSVELMERLAPGMYLFTAGDYSFSFEIA